MVPVTVAGEAAAGVMTVGPGSEVIAGFSVGGCEANQSTTSHQIGHAAPGAPDKMIIAASTASLTAHGRAVGYAQC